MHQIYVTAPLSTTGRSSSLLRACDHHRHRLHNDENNKITVQDGGSTALKSTVSTVNTDYIIFTVYTIQTALHCLNSSMYAAKYDSFLDVPEN